MNIWKKLKNLFKPEEAPYLTEDGTHSHCPNCKEDITEIEKEIDAKEKEIQEIENNILRKFDKLK